MGRSGRTRVGVQPAVLHDDAAAQDRCRRPARDVPALPRAVVAVVMQVVHRDRALDVRIPEDEVGVAARRDHALARVQAGDPRGVRCEDLHEPLQREPTADNPLGVADEAACLDADVAARGRLEVRAGHLHRVRRRVFVRRKRRQTTVLEPAPERRAVLAGPEAHTDVVLRAVRLGVVVEREAHAVVQHLAVDRPAGRAAGRDRVERRLAADVGEVQRPRPRPARAPPPSGRRAPRRGSCGRGGRCRARFAPRA